MWGNSTHNRAGEIVYEHVGGSTYKFTVTTCTKSSAPADRPRLEVDWGDGSGVDSIPRTNINQISGYDAQLNTYTAEHTFPGAGTFTISIEDPNRNSGVVNIPNSVSKSFCIRTQLLISPFSNGANNSVRFTKQACNELACSETIYKHNLGAYDPDGDSLAYELVRCRGNGCDPIPDYGYPDECNNCTPGPANDMSIDKQTGDLIWDSPQKQGEYNVAIKVTEYRNGRKMGWVVRDMQIKVLSCNDDPPEIKDMGDTCVVAGTKLEKEITATDPNVPENVSLDATGEPLLLQNSPAIFPQGVNAPDSVTGSFEWQTTCDHVRKDDYQVLFEARDEKNPVSLVDFESYFIKVVAPAPKNPSAIPSGNSIELEWDKSACTNASGYYIYRRLGTYGYNPDTCQTGVPSYTGYSKIGSTSTVTDTMFVDDGDLVHGQKYCYMVTAYFDNGAESIASKEFCAELIKDVPIITHASVGSTDVNTGIDTVRWAKPTELDTVTQYPGPYHYEIYRSDGYGSATDSIGRTNTADTLAYTDTTFIDPNLNTRDGPHSYRVELYSDGDLVGETNVASTVYLTFTPNDERLRIEWNEQVPWTNNQYELFRYDSLSNSFAQIATVSEQEFLDTGLTNGVEYCYYVKSIGDYSSSGLVDPIINFSQIGCATPEDRTPPCPPSIAAEPDCPSFYADLSWPLPDPSCGGDVAGYRVYRMPTPDGTYKPIAKLNERDQRSYRFKNDSSIAGCYALSAIDSAGNESDIGDSVCVDNCPVYKLPNVFTPNQDGVNDQMKPVRSRYIEKIEMTIRNRWGQVVYKTEDPAIEWDGKHRNSGEPVPEGVYYYNCRVHTVRLSGTVTEERTGQVQLLRGDPQRNP